MTLLHDPTDQPDRTTVPGRPTPDRTRCRTPDHPTAESPSASENPKLGSTGSPTLEVWVPAPPGADFDLKVDIPVGPDQVLGRDASADITVPSPTVSRRHARIARDAAGIWLTDLGSTNGTYVNDQPLLDRHRLRDGDKVKMGDAVAVFHDEIKASDATDQVQAVPDTVSRPPTIERHNLVQAVSLASCPGCSAALGSEMWFCHRCGYQQHPIAAQLTVSPGTPAETTRPRLTGPHGRIRPWQFRQAMLARNDGHPPGYNERLALPALLIRVLLLVILTVAIVTAFVVLGLGLDHFIQLRQQSAGQSVLGHSHSIVPTRLHSQMR